MRKAKIEASEVLARISSDVMRSGEATSVMCGVVEADMRTTQKTDKNPAHAEFSKTVIVAG